MTSDTSSLNTTTQKFLEGVTHAAEYNQDTIKMLRAGTACPFEIPRPPVTIERFQVPTSGGQSVNVDMYRPKDTPSDTVLPVLIYLPGGGFSIQASDGHVHLVSKLAVESNCAVLMVHYSLSPEVKFPVALEECYSVVSYATNPETASKWYVDPTRVAVGGDSSGGNLTAAVTLLAKQRNELKNSIIYQVLYYPATGASFESATFKAYGNGYFLTKGLTELFYSNYINEEAKGNILFAPNLATTEQLTGLPPALLVVAEADVLREDGETYGRNLLKAGVPVASFRVNAVIHSFVGNAWIITEETHLTIDMTASGLRRAFAKK